MATCGIKYQTGVPNDPRNFLAGGGGPFFILYKQLDSSNRFSLLDKHSQGIHQVEEINDNGIGA